MNITIRKATIEDAEDFVKVNTATWLTTYKGLIPDKILEKRKLSMSTRITRTIKDIQENNNIYVATVDNQVIGEMTYAYSRNENFLNSGEITSVYVLKEYQGLGIGKQLFLKGIEECINLGFNSMIVNVLKGNNAIKFYEKFGGKKIAQKKENLDGILITEYIIYFDNLKEIATIYQNHN